MSQLSIYAELLLNIRQVTVFVTLPSDSNEKTELGLSSAKNSISISHCGQHAAAKLPCQVVEKDNLKLPLTPVRELSFRLPLDEDDKSFSKLRTTQREDCPWPASLMNAGTQLECRRCYTLLSGGLVRLWKALPSEHWAEMMDFWHCHKPDVDEPQEHNFQTETKGYAASNRLEPTAGVGFVDSNSFILLRDDCIGIEVC